MKENRADASAGTLSGWRSDANGDLAGIGDALKIVEPRVCRIQRQFARECRLVSRQRELGEDDDTRPTGHGQVYDSLVTLDIGLNITLQGSRLCHTDLHSSCVLIAPSGLDQPVQGR